MSDVEKSKFEELSNQISSIFDFDRENSELMTFEQISSAHNVLTNQLVSIDKKEIKTIEDRDFIKMSIAFLIKGGFKVWERQVEDLKKGSPAKDIEAFAALSSSILDSIRELKDYNKMLLELDSISDELNQPQQKFQQNNFFIGPKSSSELLEYLDKVKEESEMNHIEAKFYTGGLSLSGLDFKKKENKDDD